MKPKYVLYLASQSQSRQLLLKECQIPFMVLTQKADETSCDWTLPLEQLVREIAREKMRHVILPDGKENDLSFVLTGDTLSQDEKGNLQGKPVDRFDAIEKLKQLRSRSRIASAFCLDKKIYKNGRWDLISRIEKCVIADHVFDVPDHWIDTYLEKSKGYLASGAIAIEDFGAQFSKIIEGSYSTIRGLPLFELREALEKLGFFA